MKSLREIVYGYYRKHRRPLPWRQTRDPYHILVSEIMLQQTQVPRVIEKYNEFIRKFPSMAALDRARLRDVLAAWQGLGYNRRALALKRLAGEVCAKYGGRLPPDREALTELPGIGEATAGAILAYAFNKPVTYVETNIRSVYIHHFFRDRSGITDDQILPLVEKTLDRKDPRRWYNALMDYGVYLKSIHPNPSRRSRHYAKQSRFEGSDRQMRGRILKLLTARGRMTNQELRRELGGDAGRVDRIASALAGEGLVRKTGTGFSL